MDSLDLLLDLGRWAGLTPYHNPTPKSNGLERFEAIGRCCLVAAASALSMYQRIALYLSFSQIKLVLSVLTEVFLLGFIIHTCLGAVFWKRRQWAELLLRLRSIHYSVSLQPKRLWLRPLLVSLVIATVIGFNGFVWGEVLGVAFYGQFLIGRLQFFFVYWYTLVLTQFLKIFIADYQQLSGELRAQLILVEKFDKFMAAKGDLITVLMKIQKKFYLIKENVDLYNDIFGWPVILVVFLSGLVLLNYLDDILKNSYGYTSASLPLISASNVGMVLISFVTTVMVIMKCSHVIDEANNVITLCYKLRKFFSRVKSLERQEVNNLIQFCQKHLPEFSAAGFMDISRTTVFNFLGTTTTYLIVVIQFNAISDTSQSKNSTAKV